MKSVLRKLFLACLSFVLFVAATEVGLRISNPFEYTVAGDRIILPRNRRYDITVQNPQKIEPHVTHTKNSIGMRGEEPGEDFSDQLTIVTVGGSTTESFYVSDGKTWPRHLETTLRTRAPRTWLGNAGYSGHSSYGHTFLMEQFILELKPKAVIFLLGINELGLTARQPFDKSLDRTAMRTDDLAALARSLLIKSEVAVLALNFYRWLKAAELDVTTGEINFTTALRIEPDEGASDRIVAEHVDKYVPLYRERLRHLLDITKRGGIVAIVLTHPMVFGAEIDPTTGLRLGDIQTHPRDGRTRWRVLQQYNAITRRTTAEAGAILVDLARNLPKDSMYFYDDVHFSVDGSRKVGEIIFPAICKALQARFKEYFVTACET
jgi:lysophospholipase L1-like esterase